MSIIPSATITAGLISSSVLPIFLWIFSHGSFRVVDLRLRFLLATLAAALAGPALILVAAGFQPFNESSFIDLLSAALIFMSAALTVFIVWLIVALGFSLSMLVSLSTELAPVQIEQWTETFGVRSVFEDRLMAMQASGVVQRHGSQVALSRSGRIMAALARLAFAYFGLARRVS